MLFYIPLQVGWQFRIFSCVCCAYIGSLCGRTGVGSVTSTAHDKDGNEKPTQRDGDHDAYARRGAQRGVWAYLPVCWEAVVFVQKEGRQRPTFVFRESARALWRVRVR